MATDSTTKGVAVSSAGGDLRESALRPTHEAESAKDAGLGGIGPYLPTQQDGPECRSQLPTTLPPM